MKIFPKRSILLLASGALLFSNVIVARRFSITYENIVLTVGDALHLRAYQRAANS